MRPTTHLIITGNEVLTGDTTDTNGPFLARHLEELGFVVDGITIIGDDRPRIIELLQRLAGKVSVVVMSGGLGPTEDDHTRDAFAEAFDRPLETDDGILDWITRRLASKGIPLGTNGRQALFPKGADRLRNPMGTAPGFALEERGTWFYTGPGVPRELTELWRQVILPHVQERFSTREVSRCAFWTFGKRESELVDLLQAVRDARPDVELGYRASLRGIQVKARPRPDSPMNADEFATVKREINDALGKYVLAEGETTLERELVPLLKAAGRTLAVAESFTGGVIAHQLTNVPGASEVLRGGLVAYTEDAKRDLLGVPAEVIAVHTMYSEETARHMAKGAQQRFDADLAIATTGVAGPEPASADRPVGWVAFALASRDGQVLSRQSFAPGPREFVKRLGANMALYMLYRFLLDSGAASKA